MALQFSKLKNDWATKKAELQSRLDKFATFKWRAKDALEYHMFIIADKRGDLKFYNGPNYTNDYTKPQYQSASGNLTGVSFSTQSISFKVGVWWFTDEDYQKLINWLDPYQVNYLTFDFNPDYSYLVKLKGRADSPRYIVGTNEVGKDVYYTEFTLTWEIQGPAAVRSTDPLEWNKKFNASDTSAIIYFDTNQTSFLDMPFVLNWVLELSPAQLQSQPTSLKNTVLEIQLYASEASLITEGTLENSQLLFDIQLTNLTWINSNQDVDSHYYLHLTYDSETSLIYYTFGNDTRKLLTLLTTTSEGDNLVESYASYKFVFLGTASLDDESTAPIYNLALKYELKDTDRSYSFVHTGSVSGEIGIVSYSRINVI